MFKYILWYLFLVEYWSSYKHFIFINTYIQCLGNHKIAENDFNSINMDNCHIYPLSSFIVWIYWTHIAFCDFFWVNIYQATPIYITLYLDSVSWWSKDSINLTLSTLMRRIATISTHFRVWISFYHISFGIFLGGYWSIALFSISQYTYGVSWWPQNSINMALAPLI